MRSRRPIAIVGVRNIFFVTDDTFLYSSPYSDAAITSVDALSAADRATRTGAEGRSMQLCAVPSSNSILQVRFWYDNVTIS